MSAGTGSAQGRPARAGPLARWSVFVDFDGTISTADVSIAILDRFARGRYEEIDARYEDGTIGSRQDVTELWEVLAGTDRAELLQVAHEVALDPGLDALLGFLGDNGAEVTVVSDGLGFYVHELLGRTDVPVRTNLVDDAGRPLFPYADARCPCGLCGTCKVAPLSDARARGLRTALVGDGTSDRFAAAAADLVFAKGRLVDWCLAASIPFVPFAVLDDVRRGFEDLARGVSPRPGVPADGGA